MVERRVPDVQLILEPVMLNLVQVSHLFHLLKRLRLCEIFVRFICNFNISVYILTANCKWAPWHAWSECTATCGGGVQNRTREVLQAAANGGKECQGPAAQFRDCNTAKCPGMQLYQHITYSNDDFSNQLKLKRNHEYMFFISLVDCKWSPWGPWDVCTRTCGGGMQARSRTIVEQERHGGKPCVGDPQEMQGCNMQACPSNYIALNNLLKTIN